MGRGRRCLTGRLTSRLIDRFIDRLIDRLIEPIAAITAFLGYCFDHLSTLWTLFHLFHVVVV